MRKSRISKHWDFILLDMISIESAFLTAFFIRLNEGGLARGGYKAMNVMVMAAYAIILLLQDNYSGIMRRSFWVELGNTIKYNLELLAVTFFISFIWHNTDFYSRKFFLYFVGINVLLTLGLRVIRKNVLYSRSKIKSKTEQMLVVTHSSRVDKLIFDLEEMPYKDFMIKGIVIIDKKYQEGMKIGNIPVVADFDSVFEYSVNKVIDRVFFDLRDYDLQDTIDRFLNMGIKVHINIENQIESVPNPKIEKIDHYMVLSTSIGYMTLEQRFIKRAFDICLSIIGLVFTLILTLILGPIIYFQSPGPIFFKQIRIGKNGRKFKFYKFRSMYMDAEERKKELMEKNKMQGLMFKMDDDPRITPIGKFIRKTSLDEFPQFWNILKGDMSLIGTRPPTLDEYEQYEEHHKSRLAMKPGLTGMWQVSGRSDIVDFEEVVRLDNEYIRDWSLGLDFKILIKTFTVVFKRKGSV